MRRAGMAFTDELGQPLEVKASSWRAGGVRSAIDAGVPTPFIQAYGRWKSEAWMAYLMQNQSDLQGAAAAMCRAARAAQPIAAVRVEVRPPSALMMQDEDDAELQLHNVI